MLGERSNPRLGSWAAVAATLVAVVLLAVEVATGQFSATAGTAPKVLARDGFSQPVAHGWGAASVGGGWTISAKDTARTSVSGGLGAILLDAGGVTRTARLASVSSSDTDIAATITTDKAASGSGTYVSLIGRYAPTAASYFAKLRFAPGGTVRLSLGRRSASQVESTLVPEVLVRGLVASPGSPVRLRLQVTGTGPTTLRARAWSVTTPEPAGWQAQATDTTSGLQGAGGVGLSAYLSRGAANAPTVVSVDDVLAVSTTENAGSPAPSDSSKAPSPAPSRSQQPPSPPAGSTDRPVSTTGVGSAPVGAARYAVPKGAVVVAPGGSDSAPGTLASPVATIARAVALAHAGGTVVLRGGTYDESLTIAKPVTVQAYPGEAVWLDGTRPVTGFVRDGNAWRVDGWNVSLDHSPTYKRGAPDGSSPGWSFVDPAYPAAAYPDQVWIAGQELRQVLSRSALGAGTFYVDTANHRLYLGSDPSRGAVRASVLTTALTVTAPDVTLRGFGVRRYATSVWMMGTVRVYAQRATLQDLVIRDNATQGLSVSALGGTVRDVTVEHNGLLGMHANYADGLRVTGLLAENNNSQHFNKSPVSGGLKITRTRGLTVRDSAFLDNVGSGLWADESTYNGVIVGNTVARNTGNGIVLELSQKYVIADNVMSDNGMSGLRLDGTGGVSIWNNTFERNNRDLNIVQGRRSQFDLSQPGHDPRQPLPDRTVPWLAADIAIHNNVFDNSTGNALLAMEDYTHRYSAAALRITTDNNAYLRARQDSPTWLVVWARAGANPGVYPNLNAFTAATGQESAGAVATSGRQAAASATGVAAPLPAGIAGQVGQAPGTRHLGAWR